MKREEINILIRRAKSFEDYTKFALSREEYDLAMFHLDQAFQLNIKAKLLELKGSYPRTHFLRVLLEELSNIFKKDKIKKIIEENKMTIRNLERSYITARYLPDSFFKEEVEEAQKLLEKIKEILWK
jgi:HEPN domain-containing protein